VGSTGETIISTIRYDFSEESFQGKSAIHYKTVQKVTTAEMSGQEYCDVYIDDSTGLFLSGTCTAMVQNYQTGKSASSQQTISEWHTRDPNHIMRLSVQYCTRSGRESVNVAGISYTADKYVCTIEDGTLTYWATWDVPAVLKMELKSNKDTSQETMELESWG